MSFDVDPAPSSTRSTVLVTGGAGFVGRSVVPGFLARGLRVTVADLDPARTDDHQVTSVIGDLRDAKVRDKVITDDIAGVVHLAALTSVLRSKQRPSATHEMNVTVTAELLELCRQRGVPRFMLASTNAVTGDVGTDVITERVPLRPLTPYGASKAAGEMVLAGYAGAYDMACCSLRFTNIYGPGMLAKDSFVPRLMRAALSGGAVEVYGDGKQRRDLVHISDIVAGVTRAWERNFVGTAIIGSGESISVLEMVDVVRDVTGAELPVRYVPAPTGEMPAVIVDIGKAGAAFGYRPAMSLHEGMATVWDDFRANAGSAANDDSTGGNDDSTGGRPERPGAR